MTSADERDLSVRIEDAAGYDSIRTIETVYSRDERGRYGCCWPDCNYRSTVPAFLWRHIHGLAARSPHQTPAEFVEALAAAKTALEEPTSGTM